MIIGSPFPIYHSSDLLCDTNLFMVTAPDKTIETLSDSNVLALSMKSADIWTRTAKSHSPQSVVMALHYFQYLLFHNIPKR